MDCHARRVASALLMGLALSAAPALAEKKPQGTVSSSVAKVAPGSLLVHVDPKTMRIGLKAAAGTVPLELSADVLEKLNTSWDGVVAEKRPDGVTSFDLKGRFQPVWIAVVDAEGKAQTLCLTSLPPDVETAARAVRAKSGAGK